MSRRERDWEINWGLVAIWGCVLLWGVAAYGVYQAISGGVGY